MNKKNKTFHGRLEKKEDPHGLNVKIVKPKEAEQIRELDKYEDYYELFPRATAYYRLGIIDSSSKENLDFIKNLEKLLNKKEEFIDKENPKQHEGEYTAADKIFGGKKYEMFQMASSVIEREKSRVGIAKSIEPKDIIQGSVGNCYFMSAIASIISIYPEAISERIVFEVNPAKYCVVSLFISGKWKNVVTDELFPCRQGHGGPKPIYSKPHTNQIWVMLIEKAWAKVFGAYQNIASGSSIQAFQALTGAPCSYHKIEKPADQILCKKALIDAVENRHVATVSGSDYLTNLSEKEKQQIGLVSGHAYSFLKVIDVGEQKLVRLRNPWGGDAVWKGRWSIESKEWTSQLRKKFNYTSKFADGSFYISFDDFFKYFQTYVICRLNPNYSHSTLAMLTHKRKSNYVEMRVSVSGSYTLGLYQEGKRMYEKVKNVKNYEYSGSRMIVLHKNGMNNLKYCISKNCNKEQVNHLTYYFEEGVYILSLKVFWQQWDEHQCNFTVYGPDKVDIELIDRKIAPKFKEQMVRSYAEAYPGKKSYYENIGGAQAYKQSLFSYESGIGYIRMNNLSKKQFTSTQTMPESKGVKLIKPYKFPLVFEMKPNTEQIVGFFVSFSGYSYKTSEKLSYK